jgi:hypothetical protein
MACSATSRSPTSPRSPRNCTFLQISAATPTEPAGLAAQSVPCRPGRGRARLPARRTTRLGERRRSRAGHHLAVAAQSLPAARAGDSGPQPRGDPPARDRRRPKAPPATTRGGHRPGVCGAQPRRSDHPGPHRPGAGRQGTARRGLRGPGARVVVGCTAKATPPSPAPAPGRSPGAPSAPTAARPTAGSTATATAAAGPSAPTDPTSRSGRWLPMFTDPIDLAGSTATRFRADLVTYLDSPFLGGWASC